MIRFVIASYPRCGTHMLRTALSRHRDVWFHAEVFNQWEAYTKPWHGWSARRVLDDLMWAPAMYHEKAVGIPVHIYHGKLWEFWDHIRERPEVLLIRLGRRQKLARAISHIIAGATMEWQRYSSLRPDLPPVVIDPEDVLTCLQRYDFAWREWSLELGERCQVSLTYEDLVEDWQGSLGTILKALGVNADYTPSPQTAASCRKKSLRDRVANWDELVRALEGTEWERFAEEEDDA